MATEVNLDKVGMDVLLFILFVSTVLFVLWCIGQFVGHVVWQIDRARHPVTETKVVHSAFRQHCNNFLRACNLPPFLAEYFISERRSGHGGRYYPVRVLKFFLIKHFKTKNLACIGAGQYLNNKGRQGLIFPLEDKELATVEFTEQGQILLTAHDIPRQDHRGMYSSSVISNTIEQNAASLEHLYLLRSQLATISEAVIGSDEQTVITASNLTFREGDPTAEDL